MQQWQPAVGGWTAARLAVAPAVGECDQVEEGRATVAAVGEHGAAVVAAAYL